MKPKSSLVMKDLGFFDMWFIADAGENYLVKRISWFSWRGFTRRDHLPILFIVAPSGMLIFASI